MLVSIPPKYAVSQVVGSIKVKSAIHLARTYIEKQRNFTDQHIWARGYFVSTAGRDKFNLQLHLHTGDQRCEDGSNETVPVTAFRRPPRHWPRQRPPQPH